jgi:hypothetical protein
MTRPPLPAPLGVLAAALLLGASCARAPEASRASSPGAAAFAASQPGAVYAAPPPSPAQRDQAALAAACREQADRIVAQRDRGDLMREEEREARVGASASLYDVRRPIERLSRQFYRDRVADECVQDNRREAPQGSPVPGGPPQGGGTPRR